MTETPAIAHEIYRALERLGADPELLSVIGSWGGNEITEEQVLMYLKDYNETGAVLHREQ